MNATSNSHTKLSFMNDSFVWLLDVAFIYTLSNKVKEQKRTRIKSQHLRKRQVCHIDPYQLAWAGVNRSANYIQNKNIPIRQWAKISKRCWGNIEINYHTKPNGMCVIQLCKDHFDYFSNDSGRMSTLYNLAPIQTWTLTQIVVVYTILYCK